jgi:hypothetical protein
LADAELRIEQLRLPVHTLDVYVDDDGRVWTQDALFERESIDERAKLSGSKDPPAHAANATRLSSARQSPEPNAMVRAFGSFFAR